MATVEQLAVLGGQTAVSSGSHRFWPDVRQDDRDAVLAVLDRGILCGANAPEITALQREWAEYLGVEHCLALNSGTAALHCCLGAAGVRTGDEVIVPAYTFSATAMAVAQQGGVPVFVDVHPRTYNIDPAKIEERITERTRAIVPVHLHGLPADMDEIDAIANRHGLVVVEDAAQSHGALYQGHKTGTLASCAGFSLNATKNMSGGEGGLFVTSDDEFMVTARRLSVFGEDVPPTEPGEFRSYWSVGVGWNYRSQELASAFARSQLHRLDEYNAIVQTNGAILTEGLAKLPGVQPPYVPEDRTSVYHKFRVRLEPATLGFDGYATELRDRVVNALRAEGVEAGLWQTHPLPASPAFRRPLRPWHPDWDDEPLDPYDPADFPETSKLLDESLILGSEPCPLFVQEPELMHSYVDAFAKVLGNLDALLDLPFEPVRIRY
jgi:dTDP-4-amino-4,6-dideoxygalactose transaminase